MIDLDPMDTLPAVIAKRAQATPDRVFLQEVGGDTYSYFQAHLTFITWAGALARLGVEAGDRVAVMLPSSLSAVSAWLGIAWLGALEVPINTGFRGQMLNYIAANSGAKVLVVAERYLDRLRAIDLENTAIESVVVPDAAGELATIGVPTWPGAAFLADVDPNDHRAPPNAWDVATVLYTGGTTGPSKGVLLPWGAMTHTVRLFPEVGPDDAFYAPFPLFHGTGKVPLVTMAYAGGREVIRESFKTDAFWADVDRYGCTMTVLLATMAIWLLGQPPSAEDQHHSLRRVIMAPLVDGFRERFGVSVRTHYGMTEAGAVFNRHEVIDNLASCGAPAPGYEVRIVDEHDYEVPTGEVGELVVRPAEPWIMSLGYLGMPQKTAEAWRNGWFHTGDGFRRDPQGNYYFVDRIKDYIRRRGENISSFEVERFVAEHPDVLEVAAIGVPSEHGEDEIKIVVVLHPDRRLTPQELLEFLIPRMPRYMVPRFIELVSELPHTEATNRVRKVELRAQPFTEGTWDRDAAGIVVS
jgi:crotonobetaine/carnitine-CoA ligase